jgi:hypothetical protein
MIPQGQQTKSNAVADKRARKLPAQPKATSKKALASVNGASAAPGGGRQTRRSTRGSIAAAVAASDLGSASFDQADRPCTPDATLETAEPPQILLVVPDCANEATNHDKDEGATVDDADATPTASPAIALHKAKTGTAVMLRKQALEGKILAEKQAPKTPTFAKMNKGGKNGKAPAAAVSNVVKQYEMLSPSASPVGSPRMARGVQPTKSNLQFAAATKALHALPIPRVAASSNGGGAAASAANGKRKSDGDEQGDGKRRHLAAASTNDELVKEVKMAGPIAGSEFCLDVADDDAADADDEAALTPGSKGPNRYVANKKDVLGVARQLNRRKPSRNMKFRKETPINTVISSAAITAKTQTGQLAGKTVSPKDRRFSPRTKEMSSRISSAVASFNSSKPTVKAGSVKSTQNDVTIAMATSNKVKGAVKSYVPSSTKPTHPTTTKSRAAVVVPALEKARKQREEQKAKDVQRAADAAARQKKASALSTLKDIKAKEKVALEEVARQKRETDEKNRLVRLQAERQRREKEEIVKKETTRKRVFEAEQKRKEVEEQLKKKRAMDREQDIERKRAENEEQERNRKQTMQAELRKKRDAIRERQALQEKANREKQAKQEDEKREREKKEVRRVQLEQQLAQMEQKAAQNAARPRPTVISPREHTNYDISGLESDCSTDDEDHPAQKVPDWAMGRNLKMALHSQNTLFPKDGSDVFDDVPAPNLDEIFPVKDQTRKIRPRTSSALWSPSPTKGLHKKA